MGATNARASSVRLRLGAVPKICSACAEGAVALGRVAASVTAPIKSPWINHVEKYEITPLALTSGRSGVGKKHWSLDD